MALIDQHGRPISNNKKPDFNQVAVRSIRDRWSSYPSNNLTPEKLARIFKEADAGDIYRQMELFEEMEEKDTHMFSELQKRKLAVLGLDYEIHPYSDTRQDKKAAQLVKDAMEFRGLEDALLDILDAIGKGFSCTEILWCVKNNQVMIDRLEWVHQKRITFGDLDEYRLLTETNRATGIELPQNKFIIHKYKARSGHPSRAGIIRVCAWMYLFKNYDIKDWVTFAEVFGMPIRLGKYDASATEDDKEKLLQAVIQIGTDAAGIISKNTEIEFVESMKNAGTNNIYEALANFCNREMSKAILGQTLTTEMGDNGSYAASKTHNDVRHDLTIADARSLAETLRKDIFTPLVRFNMGEGMNIPYLEFDTTEPEDDEKTARVYSILIGECGLPVAAKHVYEKFSIPEPEEGETILTPNQPAAYPGFSLKSLKDENKSHKKQEQQFQIDALADLMREEAAAVLQTMMQPVLEMIAAGDSLEEIRDSLAAIYAHMDTGQLEELLARAMFAADLYGRWAASED